MIIERDNRTLHVSGLTDQPVESLSVTVGYRDDDQGRVQKAIALDHAVIPLFSAAPDLLQVLRQVAEFGPAFAQIATRRPELAAEMKSVIAKAEGTA